MQRPSIFVIALAAAVAFASTSNESKAEAASDSNHRANHPHDHDKKEVRINQESVPSSSPQAASRFVPYDEQWPKSLPGDQARWTYDPASPAVCALPFPISARWSDGKCAAWTVLGADNEAKAVQEIFREPNAPWPSKQVGTYGCYSDRPDVMWVSHKCAGTFQCANGFKLHCPGKEVVRTKRFEKDFEKRWDCACSEAPPAPPASPPHTLSQASPHEGGHHHENGQHQTILHSPRAAPPASPPNVQGSVALPAPALDAAPSTRAGASGGLWSALDAVFSSVTGSTSDAAVAAAPVTAAGPPPPTQRAGFRVPNAPLLDSPTHVNHPVSTTTKASPAARGNGSSTVTATKAYPAASGNGSSTGAKHEASAGIGKEEPPALCMSFCSSVPAEKHEHWCKCQGCKSRATGLPPSHHNASMNATHVATAKQRLLGSKESTHEPPPCHPGVFYHPAESANSSSAHGSGASGARVLSKSST